MALKPYYVRPDNGRRATRDYLVARLNRAYERVNEWGGEMKRAMLFLERSRSPAKIAKWRQEQSRAAGWRRRALGDAEHWRQAIESGDGRGKRWQYRLSFAYTLRRKSGGSDKLVADILLTKKAGERASDAEVRVAFSAYLRYGEIPGSWSVRNIVWQHERESAQGELFYSKNGVKDPNQVATEVRETFKAVFLHQIKRQRDTVTEQNQGTRPWETVIGEEET